MLAIFFFSLLQLQPFAHHAEANDERVLAGHIGEIFALAFSPNEPMLVSAGGDGTIRIWDSASGQEVKSLSTRFGTTRALAFSPDAQILASGGDDGTVRLWDWSAGRELRAMKARGASMVHALSFSPEGKTVISGGSDTLVHLWDTASGIERHSMRGHDGDILGIAISADGSTIASASSDGSVRLWDALANRERSVLAGHTGAVHAVAFWPNGRTVGSTGADGTIRLWDVATASERTTLRGHNGAVWALALSADGALLASAGSDQRIVLRPPTPVAVSVALADKIKQRADEAGPAPNLPPLPAAEIAIKPSEARAGQSVTLTVNVANKGRGPLYRLQAKSRSSNITFDGQRFYFGKVNAGRSAEDTVAISIPSDAADANVPLEIVFEEYNGFVPDPLKAVVNIRGANRPVFAYSYQIIDDGSGQSTGNGDGRIQKGEAVDLALTIKNVGTVNARESSVEVTGPAATGLALRDNRVELGSLGADETKSVRINLSVRREVALNELALKLFIRDRASNAILDEALRLAIDTRPAPQVIATNKVVAVKQASVRIRSGAGAEATVLASADKDQLLAVTGELGDWYRVRVNAISGTYQSRPDGVAVRLAALQNSGEIAQSSVVLPAGVIPDVVAAASQNAQDTSQLIGSMHQVTPRSDGQLDITTNPPGQGANFRMGEEITYFVKSTSDGYLYLFHIDGEKQVNQIFPNPYQPNPTIRAGEVVQLQQPGAPFKFEASPPFGLETTFAIVTPAPLAESELQVLQAGFATPSQVGPTLARTRSISTNGAATNNSVLWNSATVLIRP